MHKKGRRSENITIQKMMAVEFKRQLAMTVEIATNKRKFVRKGKELSAMERENSKKWCTGQQLASTKLPCVGHNKK
jgi:hypothetical protein